MTEDDRFYQVVLIWVRDAETFERYGRLVAATAARYGWAERTIVPEEVYGDGVSGACGANHKHRPGAEERGGGVCRDRGTRCRHE